MKVPVPQNIRTNILPMLSHDLKPLVLSTHLVPSLPIELFEFMAEIIEEFTQTPVVLLHEARANRAVASDVVDIGDGDFIQIFPAQKIQNSIFPRKNNQFKLPAEFKKSKQGARN